jgi:nucleolar complex protein 2
MLKREKKFAKSGGLKRTIKQRRQKKQVLARSAKNKLERQEEKAAHGKANAPVISNAEEEEGKERAAIEEMDVDDFLDGKFLSDSDGEGDDVDEGSEDEEDGGEDGEEDSDADVEAAASDDSDADDQDEELEDEIEQHKKELLALKKSDPEFVKFLESQKAEEDLMGFGEDDESEEEEEEEEEGGEEEEAGEEDEAGDEGGGEEQRKNKTGHRQTDCDKALLAELEDKMVNRGSIKAMKRLLSAFKDGCHLGDDGSKLKATFAITSSSVYDRLMVLVLEKIHVAFDMHLQDGPGGPAPGQEEEAGDEEEGAVRVVRDPTKSTRWASLRKTVEGFFKSLLHLMGELTEPTMIAFCLRSLQKMLPYIQPFSKLCRKMLKNLLMFWGGSPEPMVVSLAFLRIRQMAIECPPPMLEDCLKGLYLTYVRNCKFTTDVTIPGITLRGNCVVELYGLDLGAAYQHAFVYIRQLSLHLRGAIMSKTKDAFDKIYNWQYFNCLKLWAAVLSAYPQVRAQHSAAVSVCCVYRQRVPTRAHAVITCAPLSLSYQSPEC